MFIYYLIGGTGGTDMGIIHDSTAIARGTVTRFVGIAWNSAGHEKIPEFVRRQGGASSGRTVQSQASLFSNYIRVRVRAEQSRDERERERAESRGEKKLMKKALRAFQISGMM